MLTWSFLLSGYPKLSCWMEPSKANSDILRCWVFAVLIQIVFHCGLQHLPGATFRDADYESVILLLSSLYMKWKWVSWRQDWSMWREHTSCSWDFMLLFFLLSERWTTCSHSLTNMCKLELFYFHRNLPIPVGKKECCTKHKLIVNLNLW